MEADSTTSNHVPHRWGSRTVVYKVRNLDRAKTWFAESLRQELYFDENRTMSDSMSGGHEL